MVVEEGEAVAADEWLPAAAYAVELFCVVVVGMPTV